ncbi:methyltransferase domain-containing protein [Thermomonospora amylolytica]|uniref:methyltransferase domain-containing protein n=1 Tax=Thermomonospora amylolytica TaxID=1411117 RepID=UPI0022792E20|nr:methyltransferase domain-containing protein [Thermomonospora amylolytica]
MSAEMPADPSPITGLVARLDAADAHPDAAELRQRTYELLAARPGAVVADVGCGTGRAVAELTERGVRAIGVDRDDRMIALAASRWPNADFRIGDALDLPFAEGELNGYRAEKLYHELPEPARAVAEARRVLAPGGRIVLIGQDWDTLVLDSDHPDLTRAIVHARADTIASPRAARRYRALLLDAGFTDLTTEVHTAVFTDPALLSMATTMADSARTTGAITPAQAAAWTADQTTRAETGRFFLAVPLFVTAATRP